MFMFRGMCIVSSAIKSVAVKRKYADLDKVIPGSLVLSGELMLRYMWWDEAAEPPVWNVSAESSDDDGVGCTAVCLIW